MKKVILLSLFSLCYIAVFSQIPSGYYDDANGKTGYTLKTTLHDIIDGHTSFPYSSSSYDVWDFVNQNDLRSDNTIWDIYSDVPGSTPPYTFTPVSDQCGNYSGESDCYNREHSFPKSWFNDGSPMFTDFHHLFPTDGYVNGRRGNHPFGEVGSASWTSQNGSKVGSSSVSGYSGTVFEPIDEYKGDLARAYFYMATRYEDVITGWSSAMLDGSDDKVYTTWALGMLIEWHKNDPVSQKEIDRNDAIYSKQNNRNPFVDHPEYVACIWESDCSGGGNAVITLNGSLSNFGSVNNGAISSVQTYAISGNGLTGDVTITAPSYFQVSKDGSSFANQVTLSEGADFSNFTVHVRFVPSSGANGQKSGNITHTSPSAANQTIAVSGTESGNAGLVSVFFDDFDDCTTNFSTPSNFTEEFVAGSKTDRGWGCRSDGVGDSRGVRASAFGGNTGTDDAWLITANKIDLTSYTKAFFDADIKSKHSGSGQLKLFWSENYSGSGDPSSATWTETTTFPAQLPAQGSGNFTDVRVELTSAAGKQVYVALQSVGGTNNSSASYDVDNYLIEGESSAVTGTHRPSLMNDLTIFPNPVDNVLSIRFDSEFDYHLLTLTGGVISIGNSKISTEIDMSQLDQGVYLLRITTSKGSGTVSVVKE